jgi:hypothetical protein
MKNISSETNVSNWFLIADRAAPNNISKKGSQGPKSREEVRSVYAIYCEWIYPTSLRNSEDTQSIQGTKCALSWLAT